MKKKTLIIGIVILIGALIAVIIFWPKGNNPKGVKIIDKIDAYGYVLEEDETALHKKYFDELTDILNDKDLNEEAYGEAVVKLFISDFYNLDNKLTKNDVGGLQYIHGAAADNMALKAKNTIYKYIESNLYDNRKQDLPIVADVTIDSIKQGAFTYGEKEDEEAYEVKAKWTYKEDLGYQREAVFRLMHEDKKLSIVEIE